MPCSCCSWRLRLILAIALRMIVQAIASTSCSPEPKEKWMGSFLRRLGGGHPCLLMAFSFLRRAQEATELLPEDLLQVRRGLGRQACACLCLGVGTCPVPACHLPCQHVQVTGLGSAHVPEGDSRTMALREQQAPATGTGFPSCSQRDES